MADIVKATNKLKELKSSFQAIEFNEKSKIIPLKKRLKELSCVIFGDKNKYLIKIDGISLEIINKTESVLLRQIRFNNLMTNIINIVDMMLDELEVQEVKSIIEETNNDIMPNSLIDNKIFIVHGHNEEIKQHVARFCEKLKLKPIILHEQANEGRTIIEKFSEYSNVKFALILLSADDLGISKNEKFEKAKFRSRQNVIFEMGFFIGILGRKNVCVIHENVEKFELPSDYQGVIYIPYDSSLGWQLTTLKEFNACGFNVDANLLLK